jgi:hypothetical protein
MSTKAEDAREFLCEYSLAIPFKPFLVLMENGDRLLVEHPENITFTPGVDAPRRLTIMSRGSVYLSSLHSVTGAAAVDHGLASGEK